MKKKRNRNPEQETTSSHKTKRRPCSGYFPQQGLFPCTDSFDRNQDGSETLHLFDRLDDLIDLLFPIGLVCALKRFGHAPFHVGPQYLALGPIDIRIAPAAD